MTALCIDVKMTIHGEMPVKLVKQMGARKKEKRVILACVDCSERNYSTDKSQKLGSERLELKKYCKRCDAHTLHRETR